MNFFRKFVFIIFSMVFIAGCGNFEWFPSTNTAPVANAGASQNVPVDTVVTLDGSASSDANNNPLTYAWTITSRPVGSSAVLSDPAAVRPSFTADVAGSFVLALTVNNGTHDSAPASVTVTAANTTPVANAGLPQSVAVGELVVLDGSNSTDANGDRLTYRWTVTLPAGSSAVLSDLTVAQPTFTADVAGEYLFSLIVNDGIVASTASAVTITATAGNVAPVANAGVDKSVPLGAVVFLNGSSSFDANGDALTYTWIFTAKPNGSTARLSSATVANPTFTGDVAGTYVISLQVFDRIIGSSTDTVTITVTPNNTGSITITW